MFCDFCRSNFKITECSRTFGMYNTLWNTFTIKRCQMINQREIFQDNVTTWSCGHTCSNSVHRCTVGGGSTVVDRTFSLLQKLIRDMISFCHFCWFGSYFCNCWNCWKRDSDTCRHSLASIPWIYASVASNAALFWRVFLLSPSSVGRRKRCCDVCHNYTRIGPGCLTLTMDTRMMEVASCHCRRL